jgi:hypothetical protein
MENEEPKNEIVTEISLENMPIHMSDLAWALSLLNGLMYLFGKVIRFKQSAHLEGAKP